MPSSVAAGNPWKCGPIHIIRISAREWPRWGLPSRCSCSICCLGRSPWRGVQHRRRCSKFCLHRRSSRSHRHHRHHIHVYRCCYSHLGSCARYGQSYHSGSTQHSSCHPPSHCHHRHHRHRWRGTRETIRMTRRIKCQKNASRGYKE